MPVREAFRWGWEWEANAYSPLGAEPPSRLRIPRSAAFYRVSRRIGQCATVSPRKEESQTEPKTRPADPERSAKQQKPSNPLSTGLGPDRWERHYAWSFEKVKLWLVRWNLRRTQPRFATLYGRLTSYIRSLETSGESGKRAQDALRNVPAKLDLLVRGSRERPCRPQ